MNPWNEPPIPGSDPALPPPNGASPPLTGLQAVAFGRRPRTTLIRILVLVVITFILYQWVLIPVRVTGISMEPTFHDGSLKLVNRLAYRKAAPQRGDIVSIGEEGRPDMLMKRIIALPGETYSMRNGQLLIDGEPHAEPYVVNRAPWQLEPFTLGPDEYLVIGDNRGMNQRDHYFGRTERRLIVGKVIF